MLNPFQCLQKLWVTLFVISTLSACSLSPSHPVELGNSDDFDTNAETPNITRASAPQRFMLRGNISLHPDVRTISPCGSNTQYLLQLPLSMTQQSADLSPGPYHHIYGEVIGEFIPPTQNDLAAGYSAIFNVTQLNLMSAEINGCQQTRHNTVASGNEPFWSVFLDGNTLSFNQLGNDIERFTLTERNITKQSRVYKTEGVTLTLRPELCSDGMSDSFYGWSSTFKTENKTFKGCATLAADDPTQTWVGQYQGTSTFGNSTITTMLTLKPDHFAITTYQQVGEAPIIETGIWQQVGDNTLDVMMTQHQGKHLISERVFERTGANLTAKTETINGQVYSLGENGLSLSSMVTNHTAVDNETIYE